MPERPEPLIFEMSRQGRRAQLLPCCDVPETDPERLIPADLLRHELPGLPQVAEVDVVRHFTRLSQMNYGVDAGFYPLGSCTMKYNPKINEEAAHLSGFERIHPYQPVASVQGALKLMADLEKMLCAITGMERFTLQPAAGAQGELAGLMMIRAYHRHRRDAGRRKIIVPDSAHGTNPASAAMAGFEVVEVRSNASGGVDVEALRSLVGPDTAGLMLTNPNTLGLFDIHIVEIAALVHAAGGLLYYDGANANAILGVTRPGDMGFDVVHLNLHKTFSTPHGGGGPGSGPVGVKHGLIPYLPVPLVTQNPQGGGYSLETDRPLSIGRVKSYHGQFAVLVRAYAYIRTHGADGLRKVAETAVLNANYLKARLAPSFDIPFDRICMNEIVLSGSRQKALGVSTLDMAKRLLDFGYHPPTIYFPMIVKEAMMIEPTETESKETLDAFADALLQIAAEAEQDPDKVRTAPHETAIARLDEVKAARQAILRYRP